MHIKTALSYDDVLLVPKYSRVKSRSLVSLQTKLSEALTLSLPLISSNMESVTGLEMATSMAELGGISVLPRFQGIENQLEIIRKVKDKNLKIGGSIGVKEGFLLDAEKLISNKVDILVLDVAHGHMERVGECITQVKNKFPDALLVAGNVATYEGACFLYESGADIVKVGIGPGSICTTRVETGHGVPQFTALMDCKRASEKFGKLIIADGGIKNAGDIVKALAVGASSVMVGNIVAGTDEAPGEIFEFSGKKFKKYFGSTSVEQKERHTELKASDKNYFTHIEGVSGFVSYKGSLKMHLEKITSGIKSGLSYSGASNLQELSKNAEFIQITSSGYTESKHHDIFQNEI